MGLVEMEDGPEVRDEEETKGLREDGSKSCGGGVIVRKFFAE